MKSQPLNDSKISIEALEWFDALKEAGPKERAAFCAWLKLSPRHVGEFLLVSSVYSQFSGANPAYQPVDVDSMLATGSSNIVSLQNEEVSEAIEPGTRAPNRRKRSTSNRLWLGAVAASAMLLIAVSVWWIGGSMNWQSHTTAVGELRSLELEDGSILHLNTQSAVQVRFSGNARDIRLLKGEALFKVARDTTRPFRVFADNAVIQAVGTEFNVYRRAQGTAVAVIEGAVRISPANDLVKKFAVNQVSTDTSKPDDPPASTQLSAGEEANIEPGGKITAPAAVDSERVSTWRERRLVFKADRLTDIAAEFNRYNVKPQIRIGDSTVGERRLTGVFNSDDPESLVLFLQKFDDVVSEAHSGEIVIRKRYNVP